jgi:putative lipoic acid-binding regulatory protein
VEIINDSKEKLELEYPCSWCYKLIGYEKEAIERAIHEVILEREHNLTHSNSSKTGKYVSMNLDLVILNEDERNFIYEALKAHQNIKMVL